MSEQLQDRSGTLTDTRLRLERPVMINGLHQLVLAGFATCTRAKRLNQWTGLYESCDATYLYKLIWLVLGEGLLIPSIPFKLNYHELDDLGNTVLPIMHPLRQMLPKQAVQVAKWMDLLRQGKPLESALTLQGYLGAWIGSDGLERSVIKNYGEASVTSAKVLAGSDNFNSKFDLQMLWNLSDVTMMQSCKEPSMHTLLT